MESKEGPTWVDELPATDRITDDDALSSTPTASGSIGHRVSTQRGQPPVAGLAGGADQGANNHSGHHPAQQGNPAAADRLAARAAGQAAAALLDESIASGNPSLNTSLHLASAGRDAAAAAVRASQEAVRSSGGSSGASPSAAGAWSDSREISAGTTQQQQQRSGDAQTAKGDAGDRSDRGDTGTVEVGAALNVHMVPIVIGPNGVTSLWSCSTNDSSFPSDEPSLTTEAAAAASDGRDTGVTDNGAARSRLPRSTGRDSSDKSQGGVKAEASVRAGSTRRSKRAGKNSAGKSMSNAEKSSVTRLAAGDMLLQIIMVSPLCEFGSLTQLLQSKQPVRARLSVHVFTCSPPYACSLFRVLHQTTA